jgi:hypothetical protein
MTNEDTRQRIAELEALAEKAYDEMYETRFPMGCFADLKDYFFEAIGTAERAGLLDEANRLRQRLDHCRQVYRKQFSS